MRTEAIKVLLVDDKPENLLALESLLKDPDVEFYRAGTGFEALELLLLHDFALAILDVQMPEMSGFELAELMRGTERTRAVPIIFVTAGAHSQLNTFRGYEKGAVDFLHKPLDPHIVRSKVHVFTDLARQRQLLRLQLQETQRVLMERDQALLDAREALRTRDEFMSIASHELKTPITSFHLQLQMMRRSVDRARAGDDFVIQDQKFLERLATGLQVCERQSTRLSKLLDELLDMTRVRLGKLELKRTRVNLSELVREIVTRFRTEADHQGIEISMDEATDIFGEWDLSRIEQVVTNLISNAIKYGERKPISICVEASPEKGIARLKVKDHGIGIPEKMQKIIFERFERAVSGSQISGLGLGLYITRQIVEAHGGFINVVSREKEGSTFTVEIPLFVRNEQLA